MCALRTTTHAPAGLGLLDAATRTIYVHPTLTAAETATLTRALFEAAGVDQPEDRPDLARCLCGAWLDPGSGSSWSSSSPSPVATLTPPPRRAASSGPSPEPGTTAV